MGPITNPNTPKKDIPPNIETVIKASDISKSLPTRIGLNKLSTKEIIKAATNKMLPLKIAPLIKKNTATGTITKAGPIAGITASNIITTVHKKTDSIPTKYKTIPPNIP